jgi:hypothetical protein
MKIFRSLSLLMAISAIGLANADTNIPVSDPNIAYSPYNWFRSGDDFAQTPNPGAYLKFAFTGSSLTLNLDTSPLTSAKVPDAQYPVIRYSIDGGPATTVHLSPTTVSLPCAKGLKDGIHSFLLQYVAGYVFLDFWSPVNVIKVKGFTLDNGAKTTISVASTTPEARNALFLGDSITNGDDNTATFAGGITNAVDTQDATLGYPAVVAAATHSEYGIVAYGGASWGSKAADGNTPGLMTFWSMIDKEHSRLKNGKLSPIPDDIYVNMGENRPPNGDDVPTLITNLRGVSNPETNIFIIIPFSGRSSAQLTSGVSEYRAKNLGDRNVYLIDVGYQPYLNSGPTMMSVDGQHPLASLHSLLGAQIVAERAKLLSTR